MFGVEREDSTLSQRNSRVLAQAKGKVQVLDSLSRCALQQVVDGRYNNHTLAARVHAEPTDTSEMLACVLLHKWHALDHMNELLVLVSLLINLADVA